MNFIFTQHAHERLIGDTTSEPNKTKVCFLTEVMSSLYL